MDKAARLNDNLL